MRLDYQVCYTISYELFECILPGLCVGVVELLKGEYQTAYEEFLNLLGDENYNQAVVVNNAAMVFGFWWKIWGK